MLNVAVLVTVGTFSVVYSSIDPTNATQLSSPTMSCNRKLGCIDGINATIYHKKSSHSD